MGIFPPSVRKHKMFGSSQTMPRAHDDSKVSVLLDAPKDDPITYEELSKCNGTDPSKPVLIAIKGTVFDVSRNRAYQPGGPYHVFTGKDPSRALAISSLKPEDCVPEWHDLEGCGPGGAQVPG